MWGELGPGGRSQLGAKKLVENLVVDVGENLRQVVTEGIGEELGVDGLAENEVETLFRAQTLAGFGFNAVTARAIGVVGAEENVFVVVASLALAVDAQVVPAYFMRAQLVEFLLGGLFVLGASAFEVVGESSTARAKLLVVRGVLHAVLAGGETALRARITFGVVVRSVLVRGQAALAVNASSAGITYRNMVGGRH
jgi:hypothetical protein